MRKGAESGLKNLARVRFERHSDQRTVFHDRQRLARGQKRPVPAMDAVKTCLWR